MKKIFKTLLVAIPTVGVIGGATAVGVVFSIKNKELNDKYTNLNQTVNKTDNNPFIVEAVSNSLQRSKELLQNLQEQVKTNQEGTTKSIQELTEKLNEALTKVNAIKNQIQTNEAELEKARQDEIRLSHELDVAKTAHNDSEQVNQLAIKRSEAHQRVWLQDSLLKQLQTQLHESLNEKNSLEVRLKQVQIEHENLIHQSQTEIESYKTTINELNAKIQEFKNNSPTSQAQNIYDGSVDRLNELNTKFEESISSMKLLNFVNDARIILKWDGDDASKDEHELMNSLFGEKPAISDWQGRKDRDDKINTFIKVANSIFDLLQDKTTDYGPDVLNWFQSAMIGLTSMSNSSQLSEDELLNLSSPKVLLFVIRVLSALVV